MTFFVRPTLTTNCPILILQAHQAEQEHDWQSRSQQQRSFALLCEKPAFVASASQGPARFALQKRLQRARKFVLVVEIFGTFVLNVVPEVSVSRLDLIKLDDLQKLVGAGSSEQVRSIVRKLQLAEAMQVSRVYTTSIKGYHDS
jgi:hypothetical protein